MEKCYRLSPLLVGFRRTIFSMFAVYVFYLLIGALIFVNLEETEDEKVRNQSFQYAKLTQAAVQVLRKAGYDDQKIYQTFEMEHNQRAKEVDNASVGWSKLFGEKVIFAFILITTVGYGNEVPKSKLGQIIALIYTMFGLPLQIIMMRLLSFRFRSALRKTFKIGQNLYPYSTILLYVLGFLFFAFGFIIFIVIPAYVFMVQEEWTYSQGLYYGFVSLTTIGLGDYVAGVSEEHMESDNYSWNVFLVLLWMFYGLGFIFTTANLFSYVMGVFALDFLDCQCRKRTAAMGKLKTLLDLINELNWQLVKCRPDDFHAWSQIEEFRNVLAENPQNVTSEMLHGMFLIAADLREKAFEQASRVEKSPIPASPILQKARANIPGILGSDNASVDFSGSDLNRHASRRRVTTSKSSSAASTDSTKDTDGAEGQQKRGSHSRFLHTGEFKPQTSTAQNIDDIEARKDVVEYRQDEENESDEEGNGNEKESDGEEKENKSDDGSDDANIKED